MYLGGCEVDYLETLEASGFKFNNPNVKSTCGCGGSLASKPMPWELRAANIFGCWILRWVCWLRPHKPYSKQWPVCVRCGLML